MMKSSTINIHNENDHDRVKMIIDINYSKKRRNQLFKDRRSYCAMVITLSELALKNLGAKEVQSWVPRHKNRTQDIRLEVSIPKKISTEKVKDEIKNASGYAIEGISITTS